jgi:hypothetical protein
MLSNFQLNGNSIMDKALFKKLEFGRNTQFNPLLTEDDE